MVHALAPCNRSISGADSWSLHAEQSNVRRLSEMPVAIESWRASCRSALMCRDVIVFADRPEAPRGCGGLSKSGTMLPSGASLAKLVRRRRVTF